MKRIDPFSNDSPLLCYISCVTLFLGALYDSHISSATWVGWSRGAQVIVIIWSETGNAMDSMKLMGDLLLDLRVIWDIWIDQVSRARKLFVFGNLLDKFCEERQYWSSPKVALVGVGWSRGAQVIVIIRSETGSAMDSVKLMDDLLLDLGLIWDICTRQVARARKLFVFGNPLDKFCKERQ